MNNISIEEINAIEVINILSSIIQKHIIKTKDITGEEYHE